MRVWSHAPPAWEPTAPSFYGVAHRVVGLRVRAMAPNRNDGFDALLRQLGAQGVAGIGPARSVDRARQRRDRLGVHPGPGLEVRSWRGPPVTRRQGTAQSIRQDGNRGTETAPATVKGGIRPLFLGRAGRARVRARPYCSATRRTDSDRSACRPSGAARCPGPTH